MIKNPQPTARPSYLPAALATAFSFLITMMGTTIPTPLYAIYSQNLDFSTLTVTILFAVYAIGVVSALALFGRLSDEIGRRPVLILGVSLALLSAVLFLLPPSLPLLLTARVISGLGAGFMSGTGTAALMDTFPPKRRGTAGTLAVGSNTGGLALGTLLSGILASSSPAPLTVPFLTHLALCILALLALAIWYPRPTKKGAFRIRPQRLYVPREMRPAFYRGVLAAGTGFALTGVLTAVSALFIARELGMKNHALAGIVVFLAFACMALGQLLARRAVAHTALIIGGVGFILSALALATALNAKSLGVLFLAAILMGISGGISLNAAIATTIEVAPVEQRGSVSSAFFAGLYLMLAIPSIGVGLMANSTGLPQAGTAFAILAAVIAATMIALETASARASR